MKIFSESIFKTKEILKILFSHKKIDKAIFDKTNEFLEAHKHIPIPEQTTLYQVNMLYLKKCYFFHEIKQVY